MSNSEKELRYTLITDGSSDAALMPILNFLLRENGTTQAIQGEWADLRETRIVQKVTLPVKIREAIRLYPCHLLFIHRDAERETREKRLIEINAAIAKAMSSIEVPPAVCVIPIRMQEAWLLFDESAIRHAAGNRNGRMPLNLPPIRDLESIPDPKQELHERLRLASGLNSQRLRKFRVNQAARRVTEFIEDFSPLRNLSAFQALEQEINQVIGQQFLTK